MPSERDLVEDLVFECLERADRGPTAVDELLAPHEGPIAQQVRATLATLQQVGLAGQAAEPTRADRFGPYQLLDRVGSGAMGVVYRARRADAPESTAPLALKVMQPGLLPVRGNRVRFEREIRALRELDHP